MGVYDLGLTSEQFWSITPAQLYSLFDRKKIDIFRADWRSGIVCATLANCNKPKNHPAFKPTQFMPDNDIMEEEPEQTPDELLAAFERAFAGKIQYGEQ